MNRSFVGKGHSFEQSCSNKRSIWIENLKMQRGHGKALLKSLVVTHTKYTEKGGRIVFPPRPLSSPSPSFSLFSFWIAASFVDGNWRYSIDQGTLAAPFSTGEILSLCTTCSLMLLPPIPEAILFWHCVETIAWWPTVMLSLLLNKISPLCFGIRRDSLFLLSYALGIWTQKF